MTDPVRLYEEDWYAWTRNQAALLRAWPAALRPNALDLEHIAEEIEDLGKERLAQIRGLLRRIVEHLLKLEFLATPDSHGHWRQEVDTFRADLEGRLNRREEPTLWSRRGAIYAEVWSKGLELFLKGVERHRPREEWAALRQALDASSPRYDLDGEVLNPDWYPTARTDRAA